MSAILLHNRIVHFEVLGRGRPIIFLHGWVGSWRYWIPAMQTAAVSFRAYALDLWGFGDTAHDAERYALENQVDLLYAFMHEMGIGKIALIGHGLGALVAINFTRMHPEMVDRMMGIGVPFEIAAVNGRLRSPVSLTDLADWLLTRDPIGDSARIDATKADPQAITISMSGLSLNPCMAVMDAMRTPCLIVHGENDPAIQTPVFERFLSMPDGVHQIVLEQCGHFPMLDAGAMFNRLMTDFLSLESHESPRQLQLKEEWKRRVR
jgi:pimeloyl-ACP methyl ester carboxylesterase